MRGTIEALIHLILEKRFYLDRFFLQPSHLKIITRVWYIWSRCLTMKVASWARSPSDNVLMQSIHSMLQCLSLCAINYSMYMPKLSQFSTMFSAHSIVAATLNLFLYLSARQQSVNPAKFSHPTVQNINLVLVLLLATSQGFTSVLV